MNFREELERIRLGENYTSSEVVELLLKKVITQLSNKDRRELDGINQVKFKLDKKRISAILGYESHNDKLIYNYDSLTVEGSLIAFKALTAELKKQKLVLDTVTSNTIIVNII